MVIFLNNLYIFGSIVEPCYIQNSVITNRVIKRLVCICISDFSNVISKQDVKTLAEADDQEVVREVQVNKSNSMSRS